MHNGFRGGVGEEKEVESVVVVVCQSRVHRLHQKLGPTLYLVRSKVRAVDEGIPFITPT